MLQSQDNPISNKNYLTAPPGETDKLVIMRKSYGSIVEWPTISLLASKRTHALKYSELYILKSLVSWQRSVAKR